MMYAFDIRGLLEWVVQTWAPVQVQAKQSAYSRSHYSRIFARDVGETARALRSRLRLEAAAYLLANTGFQVGEVAVEVGFQTPEAFARAFRRAFGASPSDFRRDSSRPTWLTSSSGVHFHPSGLVIRRQGAAAMNLDQILFRQHLDEISRILDEMAKLPESDLDRETVCHGDVVPWDRHERTLRATIRSIVQTHVVWLAAFKGEPMPELMTSKPTLTEMRAWHDRSSTALLELVQDVEGKNLWASEFVDALCEEPQRFGFGAVLAHILVFGIHRRMLALAALRSLGVDGLEYGDPINWVRIQQGETAYVPECA